MLEPLRCNPAVEIDARRKISAETASHDQKPERSFAVHAEHLEDTERGKCDSDRHSRAGNEEVGGSVGIIDTGLYQPAAQPLHVLAIERRIMLRGIIN